MSFEHRYLDMIQHVLMKGTVKEGRNGNTVSLFGIQMHSTELMEGKFPLLTGRKMFYKPVLGELAAFFNSPEHIRDFQVQGCNYWKKWANDDGSIKVDYGNTWSNFNGVNQLGLVVNSIKENPNSRRHLISGWRPDTMLESNLPCCHYAYQWQVDEPHLNMIWIQRSVDLMIGLPSDIILAAAWNIIMAHLTGYKPGMLTFQLGDVHIYEEHRLGALNYMRQFDESIPYPTYTINREIKEFYDFTNEHLIIHDYKYSDPINFLLKE